MDDTKNFGDLTNWKREITIDDFYRDLELYERCIVYLYQSQTE